MLPRFDVSAEHNPKRKDTCEYAHIVPAVAWAAFFHLPSRTRVFNKFNIEFSDVMLYTDWLLAPPPRREDLWPVNNVFQFLYDEWKVRDRLDQDS
jgi:hypothetical protein